MIVLSASNIGKSYGTDVILENISFHVNAGDKVGIVGVNGAGKSTLMNILAGELREDEGQVFIAKDVSLGYLKQRDQFDSSKTVWEEVSGIFSGLDRMEEEISELTNRIAKEEAGEGSDLWHRLTDLQNQFDRKGGYTYKSETKGILSSMGFGEETYGMEIGSLSGGERTRLALASLLLKKPDILMLDEPTNHLDVSTLIWLEQYLKNYKGTILLISHDRYFLNSIATHIFDVENRGLKVYQGNYSQYAEKKSALREAELRAYNKQQTEIRRQEDLIRRYKERGTEKLAKRAASREKRLAHIERLDKPTGDKKPMKIHFHQRFQSGSDVLFGENLAYRHPDAREDDFLFKGVNFDIKKGERICIVGDNGIGKTTLLKIILGKLQPLEGYVKPGHNVEMGYYDQGQLLLHNDLTVIDEVHDDFRLYTDGEIRNILGRFLFRGDSVFNLVGGLSGGEKARLSLLKLMMGGSNVLVLDEPTNHLDIESKEAFEEAIQDYPGTVITVTHDRYFLNRIPNRILELTENGLVEFLGKYDYYMEKKSGRVTGSNRREESHTAEESRESEMEKPLSAQEERALKKQDAANARRVEREQARLMERIQELETLIEEAEGEMCLPENLSNFELLNRLATEVSDWKKELDEAYNKWMDLAE